MQSEKEKSTEQLRGCVYTKRKTTEVQKHNERNKRISGRIIR